MLDAYLPASLYGGNQAPANLAESILLLVHLSIEAAIYKAKILW